MTPADLRAVAARVMAGEATNEEIALAFGWMKKDVHRSFYWQPPKDDPDHHSWSSRVPDFLHSLDAADLLMAPMRERGWVSVIAVRIDGVFVGSAFSRKHDGAQGATAPTERAARVALALLCRAAEGEATP